MIREWIADADRLLALEEVVNQVAHDRCPPSGCQDRRLFRIAVTEAKCRYWVLMRGVGDLFQAGVTAPFDYAGGPDS